MCLAGKYLKGSANIRETAAWAVGLGYQQVCGEAEVWGDGITPVDWAHLDGAENVVLEGVFHSPVSAGPDRPWCAQPPCRLRHTPLAGCQLPQRYGSVPRFLLADTSVSGVRFIEGTGHRGLWRSGCIT